MITLQEGLDKVYESRGVNEPYDLIITDMNYPVSGIQKRGEELSGELLIRKLKEDGIQIPVILCSSVNYKDLQIYGTVYYSEKNDWEAELKGLVSGLK